MAKFIVEYEPTVTSYTPGMGSLTAPQNTDDERAAREKMFAALREAVSVNTAYDPASLQAAQQEAVVHAQKESHTKRLLGHLSAWAVSARKVLAREAATPQEQPKEGGLLIVHHTS